MGIKTDYMDGIALCTDSEKPPHHMGIKTADSCRLAHGQLTLKNLPTTWGLRRFNSFSDFSLNL